MNQIAELLPVGNVVLDVDVPTKTRLFEAVAEVLERDTGLPRATVVASLSAREKLGSTGLGQGIAIPHGRLKGLPEARGAYVRLANPIPFEAPDGRPVAQANQAWTARFPRPDRAEDAGISPSIRTDCLKKG